MALDSVIMTHNYLWGFNSLNKRKPKVNLERDSNFIKILKSAKDWVLDNFMK